MTTPIVYIVGADKGGVGKTTISRTLIDYFDANNIKNRAFDTEFPNGSLNRFHSDKAEIVDLEDSDGQMRVFDTLGEAVTIIDIRAGLLTRTLDMLKNIGFIDPAKCKLVVLHVLGNSQDSVLEVKAITDSIASSKYVSIGNHINNTKFDFPKGSLNVPMLPAKAAEAVDEANTSFTKFIQSDKSPVLRGYTKHWLGLVFAQYDSATLNVLS